MRKIFVLSSLVALFLPFSVFAGCCGCDPVYERDLRGEAVISAYVRDIACMDGSSILTTIVQGSVVSIIGETDGWYRVKLSDGTEGWVGARLMSITDKALTSSATTVTKNYSSDWVAKQSGKIFLAVEKNGEAWYVNPVNLKRYYLGRPDDAFSIMRSLGLGVSEKDYSSFGSYAPLRLAGRIILRVEDKGQAYYINPSTLKMMYLGRPADAFSVMRSEGIGITNADLSKISEN